MAKHQDQEWVLLDEERDTQPKFRRNEKKATHTVVVITVLGVLLLVIIVVGVLFRDRPFGTP